MKKFALIVAGGSGMRMGKETPKQFIEIAGKPVLMHTLETFYHYDSEFEFILVLPQDHFAYWNELCEKHQFKIAHTLASGGENRFQSVKNGLDKISNEGVVFIHDGVRPAVSQQTIDNCYKTTIKKGNALPVIPPSESVRYADDKGNKTVDRSKYFLVQTPQTFKVKQIKEAYQKADHQAFTDDASVLEAMKITIHLVEGNRENIKITWPQDLIVALSFLSPQQNK